MKSNLFLRLIICLLLIFSPICSVKASVVPEKKAIEWVNATGYKFISALSGQDIDSKYEILDKMFEEDIDTLYIAKFIIGKYWNDLMPDQQIRYHDLFKRYALSLYKTYPLNIDTEGLDFKVLSARENKNSTKIVCYVALPEKYRTESLTGLSVEFKLTENSGKIQIIDVKLAESSLLLTYRKRFMNMIKEVDGEMEWFLDDLTELTISNERNAEIKLEN